MTKHRTPWVTTGEVGVAFDDDGGIGKGGDITLFQDGNQVAAGRVERTEPIAFGYEYTDAGRDAQSPVADDYPAGDNTFTGTIKWIEMEGGQDSHDHLVDPGQVFQLPHDQAIGGRTGEVAGGGLRPADSVRT